MLFFFLKKKKEKAKYKKKISFAAVCQTYCISKDVKVCFSFWKTIKSRHVRKKLLSPFRPPASFHTITIFASQNMRGEYESMPEAQSINTPHFFFWQDHQSFSMRGLTWVDWVQMPWAAICYQIVSDMRCDLITAATERKNPLSDTDATALPHCGFFLSSSRDGPDTLRGFFFNLWLTERLENSAAHHGTLHKDRK